MNEYYDVPAELVVARAHHSGWYWTWSVCQPDANWGEHCAGISGSSTQAYTDGAAALAKVHRQQLLMS